MWKKIPLKSNLCFIANHQGAFDIVIILATLPEPVGFIAKKELAKIPILNLWMNAIGCIFINRSDKRGAVEVIKHGSLKLPIRAGATIIPITIAGSYKMKEQQRRIQPADVLVTIHDPIRYVGTNQL